MSRLGLRPTFYSQPPHARRAVTAGITKGIYSNTLIGPCFLACHWLGQCSDVDCLIRASLRQRDVKCCCISNARHTSDCHLDARFCKDTRRAYVSTLESGNCVLRGESFFRIFVRRRKKPLDKRSVSVYSNMRTANLAKFVGTTKGQSPSHATEQYVLSGKDKFYVGLMSPANLTR